MSRGDWRVKAIQVERGTALQPGIWYRTPLSNKDHVLGLRNDLIGDDLAWCGMSLGVCRDWTEGEEYAGLWYTNRKAANCAECRRKEKEWHRGSEYI
ncbi:hypothetical protein LCGC14_2716010 [marine sediment metagenome]|uniref:Uncharacterized protein n=1 Tax=marine sediment metagenome TaxID=412755 RepID=A0A0F8ZBK2_9ZZZZ